MQNTSQSSQSTWYRRLWDVLQLVVYPGFPFLMGFIGASCYFPSVYDSMAKAEQGGGNSCPGIDIVLPKDCTLHLVHWIYPL